MQRFLVVLVAGGLIVGAHQTVNADSIVNGSFENVSGFVGDGNDTMILAPGSTTMTGWTVVHGDVAWIGPTNTFHLTAPSGGGSYFLDLTGYNDGPTAYGGVTQTIVTTPGATYQLSFSLGSSAQYGIPDGIMATAGGTSHIFTSSSTQLNAWQTETLSFVASSSSTVITLTGYSADFYYIGLDNVSVTLIDPAPVPGSLTLLGLGLASIAGIGCMNRRKTVAVAS